MATGVKEKHPEFDNGRIRIELVEEDKPLVGPKTIDETKRQASPTASLQGRVMTTNAKASSLAEPVIDGKRKPWRKVQLIDTEKLLLKTPTGHPNLRTAQGLEEAIRAAGGIEKYLNSLSSLEELKENSSKSN